MHKLYSIIFLGGGTGNSSVYMDRVLENTYPSKFPGRADDLMMHPTYRSEQPLHGSSGSNNRPEQRESTPEDYRPLVIDQQRNVRQSTDSAMHSDDDTDVGSDTESSNPANNSSIINNVSLLHAKDSLIILEKHTFIFDILLL